MSHSIFFTKFFLSVAAISWTLVIVTLNVDCHKLRTELCRITTYALCAAFISWLWGATL